MMQYLLPLLEGMGGSAAGLGGSAGLLNALGGGELLGNVAGTPMAGGMQGATQGSGLFGALSGGGMNALMSGGAAGGKSAYKPYLSTPGSIGKVEGVKETPGYQFTQNRFRPTSY